MLTNNFKNFLALVLQSNGNYTSPGLLEGKNISGQTIYHSSRATWFPSSVYTTVANGSTTAGIHIGRGNTAPTEMDYKLEAQITSGFTAGTPNVVKGVDSSGNPYIEFTFLITNTTSTDIVISEIGYAQYAYTSTSQGANASTSSVMLFDRTVLSTPVTVPANDSAAVKYTLKTIIS